MTFLAMTLAGSLGAVARYGVGGWLQRATSARFPVGTLCVNVTGAFLLGIVVGSGAEARLAVAFLGGYTTFSTWMVETVAAGSRRRAVANVAVTLAGGLFAAYLGLTIGSSV